MRTNRQPILPEHIVKLVARFGGSSASLADIRDVGFCLVAFAGFLRYDELSRLKWTDISMFDDHMSVFIGKSKTDQLGKGCIRVIAKTGNPSCPCAMLIRYANMAHREFTSDEFIFQRLGYSKIHGYSLRPGKSLSYSRTREVVLSKFQAIGVNPAFVGIHSLRIGGASAAINNGIPEHVIKKNNMGDGVAMQQKIYTVAKTSGVSYLPLLAWVSNLCAPRRALWS